MKNSRPDKIHLIPDDFHLVNVGVLPDGKLIYHGTELVFDGRETRDFLVTYLFELDGAIAEAIITDVGIRGAYSDDDLEEAFNKEHLQFLEVYKATDIWIRPFSIERFGVEFGFIPRPAEDEGSEHEWRVEAMPSNALSFYPPWDEGGYDT